MQPSSPTITAELGSPSAVKAYRSVPISEKVIFFSAMSVVDAKPFAINSVPFCVTVVAVVVDLRPASAAAPAQSPRAAPRDRRYDWQGSEPVPHLDRHSARRSIRDVPQPQHE